MKVKVLGCYGSRFPGCHTTSLLVNGRLMIDAGTVAASLSLEEQAAISDVLLSHAHLDHMVGIAFLADNVFAADREPLRVWAPAPVLDVLQTHVLNNEIWPDFTRLKRASGRSALELRPLAPGAALEVAGVTVEWERTNHPVFCAGYLLAEEDSAMLYSSDTGATEALWRLGRGRSSLRMAFVETSFPNDLKPLAKASGHLTPAMLAGELEKLGRPKLPVKIFHMKPQFLADIVSELNALEDQRLQVLQGGEEFLL